MADDLSPRAKLLREVEGLITSERNVSYGSPTENFANIADLWTVQFKHLLKDGEGFNGAHVAQALAQVKLARMIAQPKRDNWLDLAGYAACGWEAQEAEEFLDRALEQVAEKLTPRKVEEPPHFEPKNGPTTEIPTHQCGMLPPRDSKAYEEGRRRACGYPEGHVPKILHQWEYGNRD